MRPLLLVIVPVSLLLGCTHPSPPAAPPSPEERQREFVDCFRREMKPTDEQIKALEGRILVPSAEARSTAEALREATAELERQLESPATGDPELLALYEKVGRLKSQLSEDHFKKMLALRAILSPGQKSRFLACKRKLGPAALPHE